MHQPISVARPIPSSAPRSWLPSIIIAVTIVGVLAALGVLWVVRQSTVRARGNIQTDLTTLITPEKVIPAYTLLLLADYPTDQVWQEALQRGESDTALAMWLAGSVRPDSESIADLITLSQVRRPRSGDQAATLLYAAADVARLSPELDDRQRAEFLLQIGKDLRDLGLSPEAVTEWRQASVLAHYGPRMPQLYRATLLFDLAKLYEAVGAERLAGQARAQVAQVGRDSGVIVVPTPIALLTAATLPPEPDDLIALRDLRRRAAEEAVRQVGGPVEAQAFALLNDALKNESAAHQGWISEQLQAGHPRDVQAALLLYHIEFLQRQRALAWGLGGQHFAEWTARRTEIDLRLHDAWNALEIVRIDQSIQNGSQTDATLAQRDWWATRLVQWRLSRDPMLDAEGVVVSMTPNNADGAGNETLRLDYIQGRFWRVPREYVGTNTLPE